MERQKRQSDDDGDSVSSMVSDAGSDGTDGSASTTSTAGLPSLPKIRSVSFTDHKRLRKDVSCSFFEFFHRVILNCDIFQVSMSVPPVAARELRQKKKQREEQLISKCYVCSTRGFKHLFAVHQRCSVV